jgi:hypothetical protein
LYGLMILVACNRQTNSTWRKNVANAKKSSIYFS